MATLAIRLADLITAIGTDYKVIVGRIGTLASLSTTAKTSLVDAINEVNAKPSGTGGASIADGDPGTSTTTTYSANKITALNALKAPIASPTFTGTVSGITKSMVGLANVDNTADASKPVSAAQSAAIAALISDGSATNATATTYSANKINTAISAATAALVNSAPAALDTLAELSTALGGDANFATTTATALGNRLRFDAAQTLTAPQKVQGKANLDAYGSLELGNPDTDLVALYTTAKA